MVIKMSIVRYVYAMHDKHIIPDKCDVLVAGLLYCGKLFDNIIVSYSYDTL